MFSPNQLYDYLRYYCEVNKKTATVRHFKVNGSKDLDDLSPANSAYTNPTSFGEGNQIQESTGCVDMFDQEPVDAHAFYNASYKSGKNCDPNAMRLGLNVTDFVFSKSMSLYRPIICHSEQNSNDIELFSDNFYIPVHFWSNAILSRYWFGHYEPLQRPAYQDTSKRFGAYIRDTSGTRQYRNDLLEFFKKDIAMQVYCPALQEINVASDASASIQWTDCNTFDIHVVPETLFNTEKVHLTEKVFKPIVMRQPFILFAGPNSLQYMKDYGFKTFSTVWDESYDTELDADIRFAKATKLIKHIASLTKNEYTAMLEKTKKIVDFNRDHFYSDRFKNLLLKELHDNLACALDEQEESFYKMPGGTLFHYYDVYYNTIGKRGKIGSPTLAGALIHAQKKSPAVAKEIIKKYSHLL